MQTVVEEPSDCFTSSREDGDGVSLRELEPPSRRAHIPGFELSAEDHPRHESDGHSHHGPNIVVLSMGQRNSTNQRMDCEDLDLREQSKSARVPRSTYFGDANSHIFMKEGKTVDKHLGGTPTFGEYQHAENHYIHEEEQFSLETPGFLVLCVENSVSVPVNFDHLKPPLTVAKSQKKSKLREREVRDLPSKPVCQYGKESDYSNNAASRRQSSEAIQDEWSKRVAALKSLSLKINEKMHHLPESSSRKALEAILSNLNKEQCQLEEMISESSLTEASELYMKYRAQSIDFTLAKKSTGEVKTPVNGYPTQAGSVVSTLPLNSTKDISLLEAAFVERRRRNTIDGDSICKSGGGPPSKIEKCNSMLEERASDSSSYKPEVVDRNPKSYLAPEDIQLLRSLLSSEFPEIEQSKLNLDKEIESVKNQVRDGLGKLDNHIGGFSDAYAVALSIKAGSRAGSQTSYGGRRQRIGDKKPLDVFTNQDETSHDYSSATLPSHHAKSSGVAHPSNPIRQSLGDDLSPMSQKENDCKPNEARLFQKKKLSGKLKNTLVTPGFKLESHEGVQNPAKQLNALLQYTNDGLMRAKTPTTGGAAGSGPNKLITKKSGQNSTKSSIGLNPSLHIDPHAKQGDKFAKRQKSPFGQANPTKFSRTMELSQNQSFSSSAQRQSTSRVGTKNIAVLNQIGGSQYRDPAKDASLLQGTHRVAGSVKMIGSINSIQGFHQVMLKQSRAKSAPRGYLLSDTNGDLSISTDGRTQRIADLEELDRIPLSNLGTDVQYFSTQDQLTSSVPGRISQLGGQHPSNRSPKKPKPSELHDLHKSGQIQPNYPLMNLNSAGLASSVANILKQVRKNSTTAGLVKSTSVKSNKSSQPYTSMKGGQRSGLVSASQGHSDILALVSPKNQTTRVALNGSNRQLFAADTSKEHARAQGTSTKGLQERSHTSQGQFQKPQPTGNNSTGLVSDPLERRKELEAILAESKRVHELNKKFGDASIAQWKSLAVPVMPGELGDLRKRQGGATSPSGMIQGGVTISSHSSTKIKSTNQN